MNHFLYSGHRSGTRAASYLIAFLMLGLSGCAGIWSTSGRIEPMVVQGSLIYPERIALPPDSYAMVELKSYSAKGEEVVARQRIDLEGRQVPIEFQLSVDRSTFDQAAIHELHGAVLSEAGLVRMTEAVIIPGPTAVTDLGSLRMRPVAANASGATFETPELPFSARGHEPDWVLTIADGNMRLLADFGENDIALPLFEKEMTTDRIFYRGADKTNRLQVTLEREICVDGAGVPHPFLVHYNLNGATQSGCGGNPTELLLGEEWVVEDIAGEKIFDQSKVSIRFLEDNRVAGSTSCNRFMGGFELTGEGLEFSQVAATRRACAEALMNQEQTFLEILEKIRRFDIDPTGALILIAEDGRTLTARRPKSGSGSGGD